MKVVDASVIVDAFSGVGRRGLAITELLEQAELVAPAHVDIEAISAWRRHVLAGQMAVEQADFAVAALMRLRIERVEHTPLLKRIWELRENVTAADAAYVAIAEMLDAPLLTSDLALARAPGPRCQFELVE